MHAEALAFVTASVYKDEQALVTLLGELVSGPDEAKVAILTITRALLTMLDGVAQASGLPPDVWWQGYCTIANTAPTGNAQ